MKNATRLSSIIICLTLFSFFSVAQNMTPEMLLTLNRVSALGITEDGDNLIYAVSKVNLEANQKGKRYYSVPVFGGEKSELDDYLGLVKDDKISPDGKYKIYSKDVKIKNVSGTDRYDDVPKSNVLIYDELNYRHWDTWEDGSYGHVFIKNLEDRSEIDIMEGEAFDCPQKPFGGSEDFIWSPEGDKVLYVTKKSDGVEYASSTNSDIYEYNIETKKTTNLTEGNKGYDNNPAYSSNGLLAWTQMKRDGYESDKNDIVVRLKKGDINLTSSWDGTVNSFQWSNKNDGIFFTAPVDGTVQLFSIMLPRGDKYFAPKQITKGQFDVNGIIGHTKDRVLVYRRDMNHAPEIFSVNIFDGSMDQITFENKKTYNSIKLSKVEKRMIKTTDGKDMLTWVIFPPDFDPAKKYPTLLYCQGGPQGALSQFYSYRWNFQLMAAQGYIVVAPNRRGMPGHGVEWNEQISGDYGGQNMQDYLSAIDALSEEPFVDKDRLGCVGASYGGYSVFYLSAIHENRFKTFISHDGIFNWKSMYGTTEEMFFVNWDLGGNYWDKENKVAQKTYTEFNPIEKVDQWTKPILIIQGGLDYRVPIGQGLEAFQAAQLKGIKSRLLYFPEENHWVLSAQNAVVWQREFFKWLKETL